MLQRYRRTILIISIVLLTAQVSLAAPLPSVPLAPMPSAVERGAVQGNSAVLQNIRYSRTERVVRIVFDVTALPEFVANLSDNADQLIIDFAGMEDKTSVPQMTLNDPFVTNLQLSEIETGKQRVVIDLKGPITYKIFTLANPNRVVVDIIKNLDQKQEEQIAAGIKYTSLARKTVAGPISAHIVDITPGSDYIIKPVLSNDAIAGLEKTRSMAERSNAMVAVNASYFALSGEVLGLLKIDGQIVSTSERERTVFGMLADGSMIMDQVNYSGNVTLPDGRVVAITGVNHERGPNDLILYNNYYNTMTGTNSYGSDYVIENGKITAIYHGSTAIPAAGVVLAAHGAMEKALTGLKIGDAVNITQSLGEQWDKTRYVIGAGPRLVKEGNIFVTSQEEEFPADITKGRAPRTAIGITKEGHMLLVVVDGRQGHSIGMSLQELATFMQEWGAIDAMNFDGGGSSEMVINGRVVNKPSDGQERSVGDALVIAPKGL